eukprot:gene3710-3973_t
MFFWQLGILEYLQRHYDLSGCTMVGSSAGALLSVLSACNVSAQAALDRAHELCLEYKVFTRPLGLAGVWGAMVRQWLDDLLPDNAAELCSGGHVQVVVTTLPFLTRKVISSFKDRDDLIEVALASAHIPFLLDFQLSALCRGQHCVDGSLLYMITRRCHLLKPQSTAAPLLLFDPLFDSQLLIKGWQLLRQALHCGKEGAQQLLDQGAAYAQQLDLAGAFAVLSASHLGRRMSSTASSCSFSQQQMEMGLCEGMEWQSDMGLASDDCSICSFSSAGSSRSMALGQGKEHVGAVATVQVVGTGGCN